MSCVLNCTSQTAWSLWHDCIFWYSPGGWEQLCAWNRWQITKYFSLWYKNVVIVTKCGSPKNQFWTWSWNTFCIELISFCISSVSNVWSLIFKYLRMWYMADKINFVCVSLMNTTKINVSHCIAPLYMVFILYNTTTGKCYPCIFLCFLYLYSKHLKHRIRAMLFIKYFCYGQHGHMALNCHSILFGLEP